MTKHRLRLPLAALVLTAVLLGTGALSSPAKAPKGRHCPSGGKTVVKSQYVRVYLGEDRPFACLFSDGRRFDLGRTEGGRLAGAVATAGAFVAGYFDPGSDVGGIGLDVYDLRRRRLVRSLSFQPDRLVVAAHRGWVAASAAYSENLFTPTAREPRIVVADGLEDPASLTGRTVASGPGVDTASLRITGRTIRWIDAGVLRTFRLGTPTG